MRFKSIRIQLVTWLTILTQHLLAQPPLPPAAPPGNRSAGSGQIVIAGVYKGGPVGEDAGARGVIVSMNSSLQDCELTLQRMARLQAVKTEWLNVTLKMQFMSSADLSRSVLSGFHVVAVPRSDLPPGRDAEIGPRPALSLKECLITGGFDLPLEAGATGNLRMESSHFVKARLQSLAAGGGQGLSLTKCHFEKCEVPVSWLLRTSGCTFEECRFTADVEAKRVPPGLTVLLTGVPGEVPAALAGLGIAVKTVPEAAARFWSPWKEDASGMVTTEHLIAFGPERSEPCVSLPPTETAETTASKVEGIVYRARGMPTQVRFQKGTVEVINKGTFRTGGAVTYLPGGKISWTDSAGNNPGWFSSDYSVLVLNGGVTVCERADLARELGETEHIGSEPGWIDPAGWLLGSTWEFQEKSRKTRLRFEAPGYCTWMDDAGLQGAGNCHPLRGKPGVFVKDWPSSGESGSLVSWDGERILSITRDGKEIMGSRRDPESSGSFALLTPPEGAGKMAPTASEDAATPGPSPADSTPKPEKILKAESSEITALLGMEKNGPDIPAAAAAYRLIATVTPVAGGFEAPLVYLQYGNFAVVQKDIKTMMLARHKVWPSGVEINLSQKAGERPKAGSSVTLPGALLVEGLYTGESWAPGFCATGGLMADGSVQRVSGLPSKLSAALAAKNSVAGIPVQNEAELRDFLLLKGPAALVSLQVIGLEKFDDAVELGRKVPTGNTKTALAEFAKITAIAPGAAALPAWLKTPPVIAQLNKVLAAQPRHLSAKLLLETAVGKAPPLLTKETTLDTLAKEIEGLELMGGNQRDPFAKPVPVNDAGLRASIDGLRRIKPRCHPDLKTFLDRLLDYGAKRLELAVKPESSAKKGRAGKGPPQNTPAEDLDNTGFQLGAEFNRLSQTGRSYDY